MFIDGNGIAILVSAILAVALGSIWYSPLLFGVEWMRAMGLTPDNDPFKDGQTLGATAIRIAVYVFFFLVLSQVIEIGKEYNISILVLGLLSACMVLIALVQNVVWEKKPVTHFLITGGYTLSVLWGGMGIILFWPW